MNQRTLLTRVHILPLLCEYVKQFVSSTLITPITKEKRQHNAGFTDREPSGRAFRALKKTHRRDAGHVRSHAR